MQTSVQSIDNDQALSSEIKTLLLLKLENANGQVQTSKAEMIFKNVWEFYNANI